MDRVWSCWDQKGPSLGTGRCAWAGRAQTWKSEVHKGLELLQGLLLSSALHLGLQGVAAAEPALEVLWAAQAPQLALRHDGQPCAQSLTLLHAGGGGAGGSAIICLHLSLGIPCAAAPVVA